MEKVDVSPSDRAKAQWTTRNRAWTVITLTSRLASGYGAEDDSRIAAVVVDWVNHAVGACEMPDLLQSRSSTRIGTSGIPYLQDEINRVCWRIETLASVCYYYDVKPVRRFGLAMSERIGQGTLRVMDRRSSIIPLTS